MRPGICWRVIALIAPLALAACESSWNYYWIVDNRGGSPLYVETVRENRRDRYGLDDTAEELQRDTIAPHTYKLIAEHWAMNGGPRPHRGYPLAIYRKDSLIYRREHMEADSTWRTVVMQPSVFYTFNVNLWLTIADTGVVRPVAGK